MAIKAELDFTENRREGCRRPLPSLEGSGVGRGVRYAI